MARRIGLVLFVGASQWRYAPTDGESPWATLPFAPGATPAQAAAALGDALRAAGFALAEAVLAIPSTWCLAAPIATAGLPAKLRRRAMAYRFEETLPLAAEEVRADFIESGDVALAVGAARRAIDPWLTALAANGVRVQAVCPAAVLELQGRAMQGGSAAGDSRFAASRDGEIDLFHLRDGRPVAWALSPFESQAFMSELRLAMHGAAGGKITAARVPREWLSDCAGVDVSTDSGDEFDAAAAAARAISAGRAAWIDLLRGEAETSEETVRRLRTPLLAAVAAVAAMLLCGASAMLIRAERYDRAAADAMEEQRVVFKRVFPNAAAPADVRSRLSSEERALRVASGEGATAASPPSGLLVLRDVLTRLPDGPRYRVQEVRVEDGKFTLEGQARSHGDADAIAAAVTEGGGLTADSPRTEQLPGQGVSFTLGGGVAAAPRRPAREVEER